MTMNPKSEMVSMSMGAGRDDRELCVHSWNEADGDESSTGSEAKKKKRLVVIYHGFLVSVRVWSLLMIGRR